MTVEFYFNPYDIQAKENGKAYQLKLEFLCSSIVSACALIRHLKALSRTTTSKVSICTSASISK